MHATPQAIDSSSEDTARRAYERYCERGCEDGHDVADWLAAEDDVRGRNG
jgi:hypothetical protein